LWRFRLRQKRVLILSLILIFAFSLQISQILLYPSDLQLIKGEIKNLKISFPFSIDYDANNESIIEPIYNEGQNNLSKSLTLNAIEEGNTNLQLKFLGIIPVKDYNINVIDRPLVVPGGNAIGVKMNTKGVLVVAVTEVIDVDGNKISPARDSNIKVGDSILEINSEKIISSEQVVKILNENKDNEIELLIQRNNDELKIKSKAVQCLQDNAYRLGIWVRDKTSGIGTMTFYKENTNTFGALGHGITDTDTGELLNVETGLIVNAKISDIEQGIKGKPGEIRGVFYKTDDILGEITDNNKFGIYGNLSENSNNIRNKDKIPIGFKDEVVLGDAYILSTLENDKIEKFDIEIQKLEVQEVADQKSMIIKIVDDKLLSKTGGIVQGMSGSPIIQNNRLIGAVTHVFVNDPTRGYGIYIDWMLESSYKP